jgi:hypothetical protein
MDLMPEVLKVWTGRSRYEALIGNVQGMELMLDGVRSLIDSAEPPPGTSYRYAARVADLEEAHRQAVDALVTFRVRVKTFEAELIAKPWKVN